MRHIPTHSVKKLGVPAALHKLTEFVVLAGQEALSMQDEVIAAAEAGTDIAQKGGNPFASALTDADIAVQTAFALRLKTTFADVSFYGEEAEHDRVSKYIPSGRPYTVTLDPINGTLYYKHGLPIFETIVTLCEGDRIIGALIYLPAKNILFRAINHGGKRQLDEYRLNSQGDILDQVTRELCQQKKRQRVVLLGEEFADRESAIKAADLRPVFPWRDFNGQKDWTHASSGILLDDCVGILNRSTQLIDGGAVAFAAECAGAHWLHKPLNADMRYEDNVLAVDDKIASLLMSLL